MPPGKLAIAIPVDVRKRFHADFQNTIYVHFGYQNMCTLLSGNVYGEGLRNLLEAKTERLIEKSRERNRMLEAEKPARIIITRPVITGKTPFYSKAANRKMTESFRGYIRDRLKQKCALHSVELTEISSKGTGSICSQCGGGGKRLSEGFVCERCGYRALVVLNGAKNIEIRYRKQLENGIG